MKDWIVPITVALLALVGTLAGAFLAHRRWQTDRRSKYSDERRQVYKDIWDRAEALNLQYRTGELTSASYRSALTALNAAMLKASPHLEDDDRLLISDYVRAEEAFLALLATTGDDDARLAVQMTGALPESVVARVKALAEAQDAASVLRGRVVARVRSVLQME